jgi:orotate phosphoribosyltransferase
MQPSIPYDATPRMILDLCGGFYERPQSASGKRSGPLVGYAGRDTKGQQYVGNVFANFAAIEQWPEIIRERVADPLRSRLKGRFGLEELTFCGAPEGGKTLAAMLAATGDRYIYPEKMEITAKTEMSRAQTRLVFTGRHLPYAGDQVVVVEDVCNNFSTTAQLIEEIERFDATVIAIGCFLNRSPTIRGRFSTNGKFYPVFAFWDEAMAEYEQDDPAVAADIASGNVAWKPKDEWPRLMNARKSFA